MTFFKWRTALWLLLSTVLLPAVFTMTVGILILVFYRESWDVAFGVLVLCFAVFAVVGSSFTVFLLRRQGQLAQMQAEFIANISHDFRTPLTSIRMFVDTLRAGRVSDPDEQARCLQILDKEAATMERLVNRVLTFRQLDRAEASVKLSPQDPEELVRSAMAPLEMEQEVARRLELVVEPHLPRIMADRDMLVEAIRNLVTNALKYSGEGAVVVTIRSYGEGVAVSVRDHGPAIPRGEQPHIFKRFYRVLGSGKAGTGLGLSIAKQAAQAHGGDLVLKSARGMGNQFTLRLPLVEPLTLGEPDPQDVQSS
jgi:two-component system phosphate regulon sensor histidine kinase PhoR